MWLNVGAMRHQRNIITCHKGGTFYLNNPSLISIHNEGQVIKKEKNKDFISEHGNRIHILTGSLINKFHCIFVKLVSKKNQNKLYQNNTKVQQIKINIYLI